MCRFFEFFKYYVIFIYLFSSSCFYVPCWLSQFCKLKENQNKYYIIFRKFNTNQIAFHMTCQRHNSSNCSNCVKINIITYISIQAKLKKQHVHCTYQKTMVACQCKNSLHLRKHCITLMSQSNPEYIDTYSHAMMHLISRCTYTSYRIENHIDFASMIRLQANLDLENRIFHS